MDRDLVEAARRGDREAYADLIRVRGDRLYGLAQRILRDVDRAEDALQEALVIAWRDLPGLRDPDRFDAWLHRLVVRACLAEAVRDRRRIASLRVLPIEIPAATDEYLNVADRDQLERGLRRLSPQQRALLALRRSRVVNRPRSPRFWASRSAPPVPVSTMPTVRCALRWMLMPE